MGKKLFTFVVFIITTTLVAHADTWTDPETGCTWTYTISGEAAEVSGVSPATGDITIPSTLGGCPVTGIGDGVFEGCSELTSVAIPGSVTNIGRGAFYECSSLSCISFAGDAPVVGAYALPCRVVRVPVGAKGYDIDENGRWNGACVEYYDAATGETFQPEYWVDYKIDSEGLLYGIELHGATEIVVPDEVTSITSGVFCWKSRVTSIIIPDSVNSMDGWFAFSNCASLERVVLPSAIELGIYDVTYESFGDEAGGPRSALFVNCPSLKDVTFPGKYLPGPSWTHWGDINDTVYGSMQLLCGDSCEGITNVTLNGQFDTIPEYAFRGCSALESITILDDISSIELSAFDGCSNLSSIKLTGDAPTVGSFAFFGVAEGCVVRVPAGAKGYDLDEDGKWNGLRVEYYVNNISWGNTDSGATVYDDERVINESNFDFKIPATKDLPKGAKIKINKITLLSLNDTFTEWDKEGKKSDPSHVRLNGVDSDDCVFGGEAGNHTLTYTFSTPCYVIVGRSYKAVEGNNIGGVGDGLSLVHWNGSLLFGDYEDRASVRYLKTDDPDCIISTATAASITGESGWNPAYEIEAEIVEPEPSAFDSLALEYTATFSNHTITPISGGWFNGSTGFDGATPQNTDLRIGPSSVYDQALHTGESYLPWKGVAAREHMFSLALYADVSAMPTTSNAVMVALGSGAANSVILYRDGDEVSLSFVDNEGGIIGNATASVAVKGGYHLYCVTCDPEAGDLSLSLDGEEAPTASVGREVQLANGFQIGSVYSCIPGGNFCYGKNMAIVKLLGYDALLSAADIRVLSAEYPAVETWVCELGTIQKADTTVTIVAGQTVTVDVDATNLGRLVVNGGVAKIRVTDLQNDAGCSTTFAVEVFNGGSIVFVEADGSEISSDRVVVEDYDGVCIYALNPDKLAIRNVTARQRRPWNGKVDIKYTLLMGEKASQCLDGNVALKITATDNATGETYVADASALSGDTGTAAGAHHIVWDLNAQGLELNLEDIVFSVAYAEPSLYCVIDLSAGANAASYPVYYLADIPEGGWTDEYKTTKLVLRRIEPGDIPTRDARITKPFYCGVFEVTQKQWELVMGSNPSQYQGDMRPVERVSYNMIRGSSAGSQWPASSAVDGSSFMGKIREKTGIEELDLTTEAQWEYACRAGTTSKYNNGGDSVDDLKALGRYNGNTSDGKGGYSQQTTVGSYLPNAWGIYDMHGNVWEICLDWSGKSLSGDDPVGASSGSSRVFRGGSWRNDANTSSSQNQGTSSASSTSNDFGFRLANNMIDGSSPNLVLCSADSAAVSVDSRNEPVVDSVVVAWDASWIGGDENATVVISDNGEEIARKTGAGAFEYALAGPCYHELTYKTLIDGEEQEDVYTATLFKEWKYEVDENGDAVILGTSTTSGELMIPSGIDGYEVTDISESAFVGCDGITSVTMSGSMLDSAQPGFYEAEFPDSYDKITSVTLTGEAERIPANAFAGCSAITNIVMPDGVAHIGDYAFSGCSNLVSIAIPASVTNIGVAAFAECGSLKTIDLSDGNEYYKILNGMLVSVDETELIAMPVGIDEIVIPEGMTKIAAGIVPRCENVRSLTLGNSALFYATSGVGLWQAKFNTRFDRTSMLEDAEEVDVVSGPIAAYTYLDSAPWEFTDPITGSVYSWNERNTTFAYFGMMYMDAGKTYVFGAHFDDDAYVKVDGQELINITTSSKYSVYKGQYYCAETGWHDVEFRLGDNHSGKGSWGYYWTLDFGLGYRDDGGTSTTQSQWKSLLDPGDGSLFRRYGGASYCDLFPNVESITLTEGVTSVPPGAFDGYTNLTSVTLPAKFMSQFGEELNGCQIDYIAAVRFEDRGEVSTTYIPCGFAIGELPPLDPRDGYSMPGVWSNAASGGEIVAADTVVTGDMTLYAIWTADTFTVTLDQQGGDGGTSDTTATYDSDMPEITVPTREGYTFCGYYSEVDGAGTQYYYSNGRSAAIWDITGDMTLFALWQINQYRVTFNANGGTGGWSTWLYYNTPIEDPSVSRAGHTFLGWTPDVASAVPASNVYYTAQWEIHRHSVVFDANGGEGGWNETMDYGTDIVVPEVSRIGWTFMGWDKEIVATVPDENVIYTAQWEINQYVVTFDANGGVGGWSARQDYDSAIVPPVVSRFGCTFEGWSTNPVEKVPDHDVTYVAQWKVWDITVDSAASSVKELYPDDHFRITNIVIGAEVECLPAGFFEGCDALEYLTFLSPDTDLGDNDLRTVGRLYETQPDGYWIVQGVLFGYKGRCPRKIPGLDSIKLVMDCALEGCTALTNMTFTTESILKCVGTNAFKGCTELKAMTLPPSLEEIGDEAFMGCSYLGNVIVPGSVKHVGDRAFKNCTGFTAAQIEYGVESLGEEAFFGDWRIREVDIPSTVTNIGINAFGGDSSMIRIGLRGDIRKASEIFSNYAHIREATVKECDGEIVDGLFSGFLSLMDVHFIGDCPALENEGRLLYEYTPSAATGNHYSDVTNALVTYVEADSTGWDGTPGSHSLPQAWPLVGSYRRSIAIWDSPTYLCRFDSNGGTLGVQDTYQYSEKTITLPPEPVQTGYTFAGWWTQPVGGLRVTADTIFIEGVYTHLYAHWTKGHWVFLDANGGTVVNDFVTYVEQSVYGVLPTPVRSGYAFGGWLYNGTRIEPETVINEKADHTLVAQWTANLYSVMYHANGGDGDMEDQSFVYGTAQNLRKDLFTRSGYEFLGWATNEVDVVGFSESADGIVVYADCESVSNMTAVADDWIDLYAVWREPLVVAAPVVTPGDGGVFTEDSCIVTISCATKDAIIYYSAKGGTPRLTEAYRYKGPFEITDTATIKAVAVLDGEKSEYTTVTITKRVVTLADALGVGEGVSATTGGNAGWIPIVDDTASSGLSAKSDEIGDGEETWLNVAVFGKGTLSFRCKVSCEHDDAGDFSWDLLTVLVDSEERKDWRIDGESGWLELRTVEFTTGGDHNVTWIYRKDEEPDTADGEDCAWVSGVVWAPNTEPDEPEPSIAPVVTIDGTKMDAPVVDAESGKRVIAAKEGQTLTEEDVASVTISSPLDSSDITEAYVKTLVDNQIIVELATPAVESVEEEDKVENDPSGMLVDVEPQQIEEKPEPKEGEEVGALPVKTYPGLYYQVSWGDDLGDMTTGEKVQATGEKLYLGVIKQTGDKGFYKISVSEE